MCACVAMRWDPYAMECVWCACACDFVAVCFEWDVYGLHKVLIKGDAVLRDLG